MLSSSINHNRNVKCVCVCVRVVFLFSRLQSHELIALYRAHSVIDITWMRFVCNVHAFCVLTQTSTCNNYFCAVLSRFYLLFVSLTFPYQIKHVELLEICRLCIQIGIGIGIGIVCSHWTRLSLCISLHSLSAFAFAFAANECVHSTQMTVHRATMTDIFEMWGKFVLKIISRMLNLLLCNLNAKTM